MYNKEFRGASGPCYVVILLQTLAATPRLPAGADVSQSVGQTSRNQLGLEGHSVASQDQQSRLETDGCDRLQPGVCTEGLSLSSATGTFLDLN